MVKSIQSLRSIHCRWTKSWYYKREIFDICCHNTNCLLPNRRFKYLLIETNINILFSFIYMYVWIFLFFLCGSIISVKPIKRMIMWSIKWFISTNHKCTVIRYIATRRKVLILVIKMNVKPVCISSRSSACDFIYKQKGILVIIVKTIPSWR